jgi:hypothetical protein
MTAVETAIDVRPFRIEVPEEAIGDLRQRTGAAVPEMTNGRAR